MPEVKLEGVDREIDPRLLYETEIRIGDSDPFGHRCRGRSEDEVRESIRRTLARVYKSGFEIVSCLPLDVVDEAFVLSEDGREIWVSGSPRDWTEEITQPYGEGALLGFFEAAADDAEPGGVRTREVVRRDELVDLLLAKKPLYLVRRKRKGRTAAVEAVRIAGLEPCPE